MTERDGYLDEARLLSSREPLTPASLARIDSRHNTRPHPHLLDLQEGRGSEGQLAASPLTCGLYGLVYYLWSCRPKHCKKHLYFLVVPGTEINPCRHGNPQDLCLNFLSLCNGEWPMLSRGDLEECLVEPLWVWKISLVYVEIELALRSTEFR
jgi:hypothetical protein